MICHGDREKGFFIQSIENSKGLGTCTITNSTFVDNLRFIEGNFTTLDFNNNLTQGLYYPLMDIKVKTSAKIRNSRFFSHKPSFTQKYSMGIFDRFDALLYLHNDYESAEILIDNDVFVGKEHFDFIHSENQKESRMVKKSEEQEERLAIKGPSSACLGIIKMLWEPFQTAHLPIWEIVLAVWILLPIVYLMDVAMQLTHVVMKSKNVVSIIVLGHVRDCLDRRWFPIVSL